MSEDYVPHDLQAEYSLLGAMLLSRDAIEEAVNLVGAEDFYSRANRLIFSAIADVYSSGGKVDPIIVSSKLDENDLLPAIGGPGVLIELQADTPSVGNAGQYAKVVLDRSNGRRVIAECEAAIDRAMNLEDPEEVRDILGSALSIVSSPLNDLDALSSIDDFLQAYANRDRTSDWVVDDLLKSMWRCVVVAGEGGGKSVLLRQFALAAAQGVHPFTMAPLKVGKVPTLIVDCENPDDSVFEVCEPITERLERWFEDGRAVGHYEEGKAWLYHKPGGINLRNRVDLAKLDAVIATVQPKLVCAGPLYKMWDEAQGDTTHTAMKATLGALDKLRTRHGFALLLEHHAPHGHGSSREMRPEGSSLLMRWPELGLGMSPHKERGRESKTHVQLTRWRKDRTRNGWPGWIRRELEMSEDHMPWRACEKPTQNRDFSGMEDGMYDD